MAFSQIIWHHLALGQIDENLPGVVTERAGTTVVLRNDRTAQFTSVQLSRLMTGAHAASTAPAAEGEPSLTLAWYGITEQQRPTGPGMDGRC